MTPPPMSMLPVMENTMATKICSRSRAIAVVLLILALADIGRGRSDREVTALARFSREHKGALFVGGILNNRIGRYQIPGADPHWTGPTSYWGGAK